MINSYFSQHMGRTIADTGRNQGGGRFHGTNKPRVKNNNISEFNRLNLYSMPNFMSVKKQSIFSRGLHSKAEDIYSQSEHSDMLTTSFNMAATMIVM